MPLSTIMTNIKTLLLSVSGVEIVFDYQRFCERLEHVF